jgi:hypothetical protein
MNKTLRVIKKSVTGEVFVILFPTLSFYFLRRRYRSYLKKLAHKKLPMVIRIEYGGLGDHLVYSALPDIILKEYGVRTEISLSSEFRVEEIKDFVWSRNPYVSFSSERGMSIRLPKLKKYTNYNSVLVDLFSVKGHDLFSVYYVPKLRPELADKVICDLTFGPSGERLGYRDKDFWKAVVQYLRDNFQGKELILLDPVQTYINKELLSYVRQQLNIKDVIVVHSPYELADIITSARERVFLLSGAKSMAAAYGKPARVLDRGLLPRDYFHYATNTYIII